MWMQRRDVAYSPQGIAKALQHGAQTADLEDVASACIECGACDRLCPEQIDLSGMISSLSGGAISAPDHDFFEMSCDSNLQQYLGADDLYVIDARPFHANYAERLAHYDALKKATGCQMNLDLNRMAIVTGISSRAASKGQFDVRKQIEWLIQGRRFDRIVVENPADKEMLAQVTGKPVISVADVIRSSEKHA